MTHTQRLRLRDLGTVITGKTPSTRKAHNFDGPIPFVTPGDVEEPGSASRTLSLEGAKESRLAPAGSSLVCCIGTIGKVGIADREVAFNQQLNAVVPNRQIVDPTYLFHALRNMEPQMRQQATSTTVPILNKTRFEELSILVPSISEQRRIAAILDQAQALVGDQHALLDGLDLLDRSVFLDMFGPEAVRAVSPRAERGHSQGWEWQPLNQVATMATGHTPDRERAEYWGGEIPWIALPDIRALDGKTANSTSLFITDSGLANSSAVLLPTGTVCFSRTASIGFVTKTGRPMATSQDFHNWTPGPNLDGDYLMAALRVSRAHLLGSSDGSTHKTIYQRVAERFHILLPPLELQKKFSELLCSTQAVRVAASLRLQMFNEGFVSIQSRAFSGRL